jgi:hypothetical protein
MSASRLDPNDTNGLRGLRGLLTGDERIRGEQMQRIAGSAKAADQLSLGRAKEARNVASWTYRGLKMPAIRCSLEDIANK